MPSELFRHWMLDPSVTFLNHGSFGATPPPVLDAQAAWRARMEREPVAFFTLMVAPWPQRADGGRWRRVIRISAAPYVVLEDIELLANVLPTVLAGLAD